MIKIGNSYKNNKVASIFLHNMLSLSMKNAYISLIGMHHVITAWAGQKCVEVNL